MADDTSTPNNQPEKRATRISVTLPPEVYQRLTHLAKIRRVSASWLVRDAVDR